MISSAPPLLFLSYYSQIINLKEDYIMKLSNLKTWLPGMILGLSLLAAVPVLADNINSGSTPPDRIFEIK